MPGRLPKNEDAEAGRSITESSPLIEKPKEVSLSNPLQWLRSLSQSYTWKLLAMVACTNHLLKGFVAGGGDEGLIGKPAEFLFAELGVSAGRLQALKAVAIIPFALKPLVALMSDAFPIGGYHKLPYVVIFTMLSFISIMTVGLGLATTEAAVVAALFLAFLQVASIDVLMAAKSSEEVKKHAHLGPDFMTYTWLGINVGQVLSVCILGPVVAALGPRAPYCFAAPLVLVVLWPALGNFMGEHPAPGRAGWPLVFQQHKVLCRLTLLIGALALFLVVSTFIMDERQLLQIAAAMASIVLVSFAVFIRREIAGPVIFFFLLGLLNLNIDGALFYFCTDDASEFPAGPHFSPKFYITGLGGATFLGITVGYASGPGLFRSWSYRNICYITLVMRATTQLAMVPLLRRMQLGIPDSYWLLMVMSLDSMVQAWRWIPKQVLAAHLTPKGVEATCLGLHAGTFNMANVLSSYCGSFLLSYLGVSPRGGLRDAGKFDNLWKVQCMAALLPLFLLFLVPVLVPKKMQTESLLEEREDSATHNSFFEQLRRRD
ncbi:Probable folate-biopterin transporter 3 [Durusdinium trenchii]|uniref:Probable folate-biopterin transporter 3 n=1 Tax=Durusdinium trenchii TaxID=1381693 RepID=A0ABP0S3G7_9DINO